VPVYRREGERIRKDLRRTGMPNYLTGLLARSAG
jgi:hypothetical protein